MIQRSLIPPRVLSYGGGLDSFALLVLAEQDKLERPDAIAFCDVTDSQQRAPGEWEGTYRHIREVAIPLAQRMGIPFHWIDTERYPVRDAPSLFDWMKARRQIPMAGPERICTIVAKVERFERWLDDCYGDQEVEVWVGFDGAEAGRAEKDPNAGKPRKHKPGQALRRNRFPLIERELCRCRLEALVRAAGYPVPRKSACKFCPYASKADWQEFAATSPEHFEMVVELEADKPPTEKNGLKLSVMGYDSKKKNRLAALGEKYVPPTLRQFIQGTYRPKMEPCAVCGAPVRASKATGCGFLDEPTRFELYQQAQTRAA